MNWNQIFRSIEQRVALIFRYITYAIALAVLIAYISKFFEWGKTGPFVYLKDNVQLLWLLAITTLTATLWIWISRLHRRFVSGFNDNFATDLRTNWDFDGSWRIPEKGTLLVAGPDVRRDTGGGITKIGAQWENYVFTFNARIIKNCLGVVVRAPDLNNYYMLQIQADKIRPHRRVAVPVIETKPSSQQQEAPDFLPIKYNIGWQIFDPPTPLSRKLDSWFYVRVIVRGQAVSLYINNELVFQQESFLQIPTGRVGFRNAFSEEALVRNVRVILQP